MGTNSALVSIIIPVYNGIMYLDNVIRSVFEQCYEQLELIMVDDGSSDASFTEIEQRLKRAPAHIKTIYWTQQNVGICETRNRALERATGKYFLFID